MDFEIEKYNQYNLPQGAKYSICPICSKHRKKKTQKCMMLDWEKGLGSCQHCGEIIQLHSYKRKKDDSYRPKRISKQVLKELPIKQTSFISENLLQASLRYYYKNAFCSYLEKLFGEKKTNELINLYKIGTSRHWPGATVFWQVDQRNKIHAGKIMLYNAHSGKRVKRPFNHITWVHTVLKLADFNLSQCFFGEHLLTLNKPIAIVESEKTAIIASAYLPKFTWLAIGSLNNLSTHRCKILEGKTVVLYPDLNGYKRWSDKACEITTQMNVKFIVSDILENNANENERQKGLDLADYLVKYPWKEPIQPCSEEEKKLNALITINPQLEKLIKNLDLVLID